MNDINPLIKLTEQAIWAVLETVWDPYLEQNLRASGQVEDIKIVDFKGADFKDEGFKDEGFREGDFRPEGFRKGDLKSEDFKPAFGISLKICLKYPGEGFKNKLSNSISSLLGDRFPEISKLEIDVRWKVQAHLAQNDLKGLKGVKNLLAVASGKGGVGKSTTAVNLALALQLEGAKVGILDADIYGPSQPKMLGQVKGGQNKAEVNQSKTEVNQSKTEVNENKAEVNQSKAQVNENNAEVNQSKAQVNENKQFIPLIGHGLKSMSMGYLVEEAAAMIWRGPMVSQALQQMVFQTDWGGAGEGELDYLIVDLPPGTGDIQLTLAQKIPVAGSIIVTTPQDIALQDAKKALTMFRKLNIPVLGVVENMSMHICSNCGTADPIFGENGGEEFSKEFGVALLGKLPLDRSIRELTDAGRPSVANDAESKISILYREIARKVAAKLSLQPRETQRVLPTKILQQEA